MTLTESGYVTFAVSNLHLDRAKFDLAQVIRESLIAKLDFDGYDPDPVVVGWEHSEGTTMFIATGTARG